MRMMFAIGLMSLVASAGCSETESTAVPAAADTAAVQPVAVVFNEDNNPTIEFNVPGLHCEHCAATACQLVKDIEGVADVQADAEQKIVTVAVKDKGFDSEPARKVLEEQFGEATVVESDEA